MFPKGVLTKEEKTSPFQKSLTKQTRTLYEKASSMQVSDLDIYSSFIQTYLEISYFEI